MKREPQYIIDSDNDDDDDDHDLDYYEFESSSPATPSKLSQTPSSSSLTSSSSSSSSSSLATKVITMNDIFPEEFEQKLEQVKPDLNSDTTTNATTKLWTKLDNPLLHFENTLNQLPFLSEWISTNTDWTLDRMRYYVRQMRRGSFGQWIDGQMSVPYRDTDYNLSNYSKWKKVEFAEKILQFLCLFVLFHQLKHLSMARLEQLAQVWQQRIQPYPHVIQLYQTLMKRGIDGRSNGTSSNSSSSSGSRRGISSSSPLTRSAELRQQISCCVAAFYIQLHKLGLLHNVLANKSIKSDASSSSSSPSSSTSPSTTTNVDSGSSSSSSAGSNSTNLPGTTAFIKNEGTQQQQQLQLQSSSSPFVKSEDSNQTLLLAQQQHQQQQEMARQIEAQQQMIQQQQIMLQLGINSVSDVPYLNLILQCVTRLQLAELEVKLMSEFKQYIDSLMEGYWNRLQAGNVVPDTARPLFDSYSRASMQLNQSREAIRLRRLQLPQ